MRPEGLDRLEHHLIVDRALSEGQLRRHHGLALEAVQEHVHVFQRCLAATHGSRIFKPVRFVALEGRLSRAHPNTLRHLAGLAEMRHLLDAPPESWRLEPDLDGERPDATWASSEGEVAVEFDAGSYSPHQILGKVRRFARYPAQVWGSSSARRVTHLAGFLEVVGETRVPLLARWD